MLGRWAQLVLALGTLTVMARFLGPELYGSYSLAILAMTFADTLVFGTFSETLVQRKTIGEHHKAAAFLVSLGLALLLALALIPAAEPVAAALNAPTMADVLPFIGIAVVMVAAGVVPAALLQRDFNQRALVLVEQLANTISSLVGIGFAFAGAGIWSLVAMELVRAFIRLVGLYARCGWRPGFRTDRAALEAVLRFGSGSLLLKMLMFVSTQSPRLFIGLALGPAAVGLFALAWRLYETVQRMLVTPMTSIAMATAARTQEDLAFLRTMLASAAKASSLVAYPAFVGIALAAPVAIPLIFGPEWQDAVIPAQILSLMGIRGAISGFNSGILRGLGRIDLQIRASIATAAYTLAVVPLVAGFGIIVVSVALLLRNLLLWPLSAGFINRVIGLPVGYQLRMSAEAAMACVPMAVVLLPMPLLLDGLSPALLLVLMVGVGALVYIAAISLIAPDVAQGLLKAGRAMLRRDRQAAMSHIKSASRARLPDGL
jgi:O-antigen/teichoic acid export membrane protein